MPIPTIIYTDAGNNLLRDASMGLTTVIPAISQVALGSGLGATTGAIASGTPITSIAVAAGLPIALGIGQSLTIINNTTMDDTITVASPGAALGATSIPIASWTPSATYAVGSVLITTLASSDTQLNNETARVAAGNGNGLSAGEGLATGYMPPTQASATYVEVGYFAGAATSTAGSGTLVARALGWWSHTVNLESANLQMDVTY